MVQPAAEQTTVDRRIKNFMAKKAVEYPSIGLEVTNPQVIGSSLKPFHEVLADRILTRRAQDITNYLLTLVKSYPVTTTFGRTHLVK
jgi:hypothetical protein